MCATCAARQVLCLHSCMRLNVGCCACRVCCINLLQYSSRLKGDSVRVHSPSCRTFHGKGIISVCHTWCWMIVVCALLHVTECALLCMASQLYQPAAILLRAQGMLAEIDSAMIEKTAALTMVWRLLDLGHGRAQAGHRRVLGLGCDPPIIFL